MLLGVITNQELMDVLQSLNNKSIWETIISVITPVVASIITLGISNKHSEKQLKIQMKNEHEKVKDDRTLQLKIEEKEFIDRETIKHLTEIANMLPHMLRYELFEPTRALQSYYYSLKYNSKDVEKRKAIALETDSKHGNILNTEKFKIDVLMAYASPSLKKQYKELSKKLLFLKVEQNYYQLAAILNSNNENSRKAWTSEKYLQCVDCLDNEVVALIDAINDELESYILKLRK